MKRDRLDPDDRLLGDAFRSVREVYDGSIDAPDAALHRALFKTRKRERRQRLVRWVVLPAAAALFASSAWAGVTGRLMPAVRSAIDLVYEDPRSHERRDAPPATAPLAVASPSTPLPAEPAPLPAEPAPLPAEPAPLPAAPVPPPAPAPASPSPAPAPSPLAVTSAPPLVAIVPLAIAPSARPASGVGASTSPGVALPSSPSAPAPERASAPASAPRSPPSSAPNPAASASADPDAPLFAEAHRLHFSERDPARALPAWDRYLAAVPKGRFAPEARYNRALALVRLGRRAEATTELNAFASGTYGSYRRDDARALLDALARDASRP